MADRERAKQHPAKQQASLKLAESSQLTSAHISHTDGSWFIRYPADGSWSVGSEIEAANDPEINPSSGDLPQR